jgi:hypothetical protein
MPFLLIQTELPGLSKVVKGVVCWVILCYTDYY